MYDVTKEISRRIKDLEINEGILRERVEKHMDECGLSQFDSYINSFFHEFTKDEVDTLKRIFSKDNVTTKLPKVTREMIEGIVNVNCPEAEKWVDANLLPLWREAVTMGKHSITIDNNNAGNIPLVKMKKVLINRGFAIHENFNRNDHGLTVTIPPGKS